SGRCPLQIRPSFSGPNSQESFSGAGWVRTAEKTHGGDFSMKRKHEKLPTIAEYFKNPSRLTNPDDLRIYRLLVEAGFLSPPEQLELGQGCCFKETLLAKWMRQERIKKRTSAK